MWAVCQSVYSGSVPSHTCWGNKKIVSGKAGFQLKVARDSCDVTQSLTQASIHTSHVNGSESFTKYSLHLLQSTSRHRMSLCCTRRKFTLQDAPSPRGGSFTSVGLPVKCSLYVLVMQDTAKRMVHKRWKCDKIAWCAKTDLVTYDFFR